MKVSSPALLIVVLSLFSPVAQAGLESPAFGSTACERIAQVARQACRQDAADDYLTWYGNCLNIADRADARACRQEALEARAEELALCDDRREARLELCDLLGEDRYDPEIDPADFMTPEEIAADPNPYFPLVPGNEWVYRNEEETITVTVLEDTIEILGIDCVTVRDVVALTEDGETIEDTLDWYTQDLEGNLWYFGEIAQNFEDGLLKDLDGSWTAGEDFARPGILIPRDPYPGLVYREEFKLREAEDGAMVIDVEASESAGPAECDGDCLQTLAFTPLEPDVAEHKFYAPGVGLLVEVDLGSGERTELESFTEAAPR